MIISASRRTDIPCYYADWFVRRLKEEFVLVKNPMNPHQISRISLKPEDVDCIVFWTKNPAAMLYQLENLSSYPYYFQFTLTGYGRDIEPHLPEKAHDLIDTFQALSRRIGREKVIWRYDPIIFTKKYTKAYHLRAFEAIAQKLAGYTEKVVVSFLDFYQKTKRNMAGIQILQPEEEEILSFSKSLSRIAGQHGLKIESCAEIYDLSSAGIQAGRCVDRELIERITGFSFRERKDKNQRKECGCLESVDIGAYDTCKNGCRYCYANLHSQAVIEKTALYHEDSPLLCGEIGAQDKITLRAPFSLRTEKPMLFE